MSKNCKKLEINPENAIVRKIWVVYGLSFGIKPNSNGMIMDALLDTFQVYLGVHYWKWASKRRPDALLANTLSQVPQ